MNSIELKLTCLQVSSLHVIFVLVIDQSTILLLLAAISVRRPTIITLLGKVSSQGRHPNATL